MNKTLTVPLAALLCLGFARPAVFGQDRATDRVPGAGPAVWETGSRFPVLYPAPLAGDPMKVTVHRLRNGLTVYLSPNDQEPRISAWIAVRAGGAQDPGDSTGMAHYLEHMLFKGSRRLGTTDYGKEAASLDRILQLYEELFRTADPEQRREVYSRIDRANQEAGAYAVPNEMDKLYKALGIRGVNAFTSNEQTVYICDMPKNRLEAWARLEGDRFQHPVFRLFQTEIETVYEEKNRSMDDPDDILGEATEAALWDRHPYGRPIIGTIAHLKNPSLEKMYRFYGSNYVPNNMAVALSGDFQTAEILALLERTLGQWQPKPLEARPATPLPKLDQPKKVEVKYEAEEAVVVAWPAAAKLHPDADALRVMDMVFDNSESGLVNLRLNQAQRVKRAGSYGQAHTEGGAWYLSANPKEGQTLEEAEALLLETVKAVQEGEFSEEDLKANILNFEIAEKYKLESNAGRVAAMADAFVGYEDWAHKADWLKRLRAVTKADVVRVARQYLGPGRAVVYRRKGKPEVPSIPKPAFTKMDIAQGRESAFFGELLKIPAPVIAPKWIKAGRDYSVRSSPSGRLYAVKNPVNDLFSLSFNFERGQKHERSLCAAFRLLDKAGAGALSAEEFKRKLYGLGLSMDAGCDDEESRVSLSGIEANLPEGLKLLRLRFQEPNIAPDTLAKMADIWIGQHKDNKVDPDAVNAALSEKVQRGPESSVLNSLTDAEIRSLKEEDLKRLLKGVFGWQRRTGYIGTLSADAAARLLAEPGAVYQPTPKPETRRYVKTGKPQVFFVHRDMVQSQIGVYSADEAYDPKNYVDYRYYANYMGGGMSAVAFQEIREARALAYSAWAGYLMGGRKGDMNRVAGMLGTQGDKTIEATELLLKLLHQLPPSESRFQESRNSIEQDYRTSPVKFRAVPGTVMDWEDQGLRGDPRPARMRKALSYKLDDLVRFSARFRERPLTVYVLGNRDRVDLKSLEKLGTLTELKIGDLFPY
ncbi:MAG: hypothetical protein A2X36_12790 [Elusimicrobia bacterium GWA2_69_24]|nr:MAG: hypothetical protein A2X36_12790 [Elusimicrobia bacterium GWA2_69_24]